MDDKRAILSISWKAIAIAAMVVALAAFVLAAIVTMIKNADVLSVVALAVAVVAFIIQIILFVIQAAAASQQELRAQQLYGSTTEILVTIAEKAEGTRREVSTINEKMLTAILGKAIPEAASSSTGLANGIAERTAQVAERFKIDNLDRLICAAKEAHEIESSEIYSFPGSGDLSRVEALLKELDDDALRSLALLGNDYARYAGGIACYAHGLNINAGAELSKKRLVRRISHGWNDEPDYVLTADGILAARFLLSPEIPLDVPDGLIGLRQRARAGMSEFFKNFIFPHEERRRGTVLG